eukprot:scaffold1962_cov162-Amphora_coffeaeformis.AAC.2
MPSSSTPQTGYSSCAFTVVCGERRKGNAFQAFVLYRVRDMLRGICRFQFRGHPRRTMLSLSSFSISSKDELGSCSTALSIDSYILHVFSGGLA